MADELDPILESRLRDALREEAETVPITLRADAVRKAGAERRRARTVQRVSWAVLAAVVVVAVGVLALTFGLRSPSTVATSPASASASPTGPTEPSTGASPASGSPTDASASPASGLPADTELLAAAGQGAVQLQAVAFGARPLKAIDPLEPLSHRVALAVVVACTGDHVDVIDAAIPDSPLGTATCDDTPQVIRWDGLARVITDGPALSLSVPSGTSYRAMLADTSAVALDGEPSPIANGLPTTSHLEASPGLGIVVAVGEHVDVSSPSTTTALADVRAAYGAQILIACVGASPGASVTADLVTTARLRSAQTLGSVVCDGTVQAFLWSQGYDTASTDSIGVQSPGGTSWRAVVRNVLGAGPWHPTPAVPCHAASLSSTAAPTATLFQGANALGTVSYFTESWGGSSTDGVPVTPSSSATATFGLPLTLRIAGDLCATSWSVVYGPAKTDGSPGIDPVGVLAVSPFRVTTGGSGQMNLEDRLTLPSPPPGDWVLTVDLGFDVGGRADSASGLIRVHVH